MKDIDIIIITQSESINYNQYSKLPLERLDLYSELVFPRMLYYKKGFRSHLDVINFLSKGRFFSEADYPERRNLLNIWNLPSVNGGHLANYLLQYGIKTGIISNFDAEWDILCNVYESSKIPPLVNNSSLPTFIVLNIDHTVYFW